MQSLLTVNQNQLQTTMRTNNDYNSACGHDQEYDKSWVKLTLTGLPSANGCTCTVGIIKAGVQVRVQVFVSFWAVAWSMGLNFQLWLRFKLRILFVCLFGI